jgi:hypothetical protein
MISDNNWYPWFPDRWLSSLAVRQMTLSERGAYHELLDWQWQGHGFLPERLSEISQLVGFDVLKYPKVMDRFPVCAPGQRANPVLLQLWKDCQHTQHLGKTVTASAQTLHDKASWTLADCQGAAQGVGMTPDMVQDFFCHYASVDWIDGAGRLITNLPAALGKWKANQPSHGKRVQTQGVRPVTIHELQTIKEQLKIDMQRAVDKQQPTKPIRQRMREIEKQISNYGRIEYQEKEE